MRISKPIRAAYINCSLERDRSKSHTWRLIEHSAAVMRHAGVEVELIHALEHRIAFGMQPDMTEHGWQQDDWPALYQRVLAADILVLGTPIWLGAKSSVCSQIIERLYSSSADTNDKGQYIYYGKAAGCLVTGNEDGAKACSMEILYALQHIGYCVPPQADSAWLGEAGPGPSYGDVVQGAAVPAGFDNEFTNRNTTVMAWNLVHMARLLRQAGGFPVGGNVGEAWDKGDRAGYPLNSEGHRQS